MISRFAVVGLLACSTVLSACGGGESTDAPEDDGGAETTADGSEAATSSGSDEAVPAGQVEVSDDVAEASDDVAQPSDEGGGFSDGMIDVSDVDWSTVDLTTIDWENIDMAQVKFGLIDKNPTVGDLSPDVIAIIQRRMAESAPSFGSGAVTVTIDDRTFEFGGYQCGFESSGLLNEGTTFGSNLFGEVDGVRIQLQIDSYDDGTAQFTMDDIEDFDNPSVSYLESQGISVSIDGNDVHAEGLVTDQTQDTFPRVPMTFDGSCGPTSIR
jgi:hypothetical protein